MSYGVDTMLSLVRDLPVTSRLQHSRRVLPGLLPYVVWRDGALLGYFVSLAHVPQRAGVDFEREWVPVDVPERDHWRFVLRGIGDVAEYGAEDWPEPRVVLVGEVNPYQDRRAFDLYDEPERSVGGRLRRLVLGVRRETYFRRFARHNLCVEKWRSDAAFDVTKDLLEEYPTGVFVLLGKKVQGVFGSRFGLRLDTMTTHVAGGQFLVSLPHPSGLCRVWNDPDAVAMARETILTVCPDLPLGEVDRA